MEKNENVKPTTTIVKKDNGEYESVKINRGKQKTFMTKGELKLKNKLNKLKKKNKK